MEMNWGVIIGIAFMVYAVGPILFSLYRLWEMGRYSFHPENWSISFMSLLTIIIPLVGYYCLDSGFKGGSMLKAFIGVVLVLFYLPWAFGSWGGIFAFITTPKFGAGTGEDDVRRGTRVVSAEEMSLVLEDQEPRQKSKAKDGNTITIGGVPIPSSLERQHFTISGTTGAGKTQVINGMLRTIRKRGHRAVVADPAGGYYARFGRSGDLLLNPFDKRSVAWSPFNEIRADYDCERIAKAIIPDASPNSESAQWHHYAQTLVAKAMLAMHRNGEHSVKKLLYWLTTATQKELATLLAGTPAAAMTEKSNERALGSTRSIISTYMSVFDYLPDQGDFSIRKWIQEEWRDNSLFITYRDDQMGMLKHLVATFLELAIVEGLSLAEDENRGLWFLFDEVDSLGKITSLRPALTKLRKFGGRCVLGLQTISQLRSTYGNDEAQTLMACTSVKCILRAGDAQTAKSMEQELGEQEIEREQIGSSMNYNDEGRSQGQTITVHVMRQATVMASEIMSLPDLCGFLKMPGDEIAEIQIDYVDMPLINPAFQG